MNAQLMVSLICAVLGSGGFTAVITYVLASRKERKIAAQQQAEERKRNEEKDNKDHEAMREAIMLLMLGELQTWCRNIINAQYRTLYETAQLVKAYNCYKALGGDGWADKLFDDAMKQPLVDSKCN